MTTVLIAGVGNIFAGDDAFGVEVARRLAARPHPPNLRVRDFGNRAVDLAYALLDECDAAVLVDAAARGGPPGTLYVIEPQEQGAGARPGSGAGGLAAGVPSFHGFDPNAVLRLFGEGQGRCRRVLIVGCEPQSLGDGLEGAMGLSEPVAEAVERALGVVERLAAQLAGEEPCADAEPSEPSRRCSP